VYGILISPDDPEISGKILFIFNSKFYSFLLLAKNKKIATNSGK
jgi:hypothetical protein